MPARFRRCSQEPSFKVLATTTMKGKGPLVATSNSCSGSPNGANNSMTSHLRAGDSHHQRHIRQSLRPTPLGIPMIPLSKQQPISPSTSSLTNSSQASQTPSHQACYCKTTTSSTGAQLELGSDISRGCTLPMGIMNKSKSIEQHNPEISRHTSSVAALPLYRPTPPPFKRPSSSSPVSSPSPSSSSSSSTTGSYSRKKPSRFHPLSSISSSLPANNMKSHKHIDDNLSSSVSCKGSATEILPGLFLGDRGIATTEHTLVSLGITHVLSVCAGFKPPFPDKLKYKVIDVDDTLSSHLLPAFETMIEFITESRKNGVVLVHCNKGESRAATVILAYLMQVFRICYTQALALLRTLRPSVCPNVAFVQQLLIFEAMGFEIIDNHPKFTEYIKQIKERQSMCEYFNIAGEQLPLQMEPPGISRSSISNSCISSLFYESDYDDVSIEASKENQDSPKENHISFHIENNCGNQHNNRHNLKDQDIELKGCDKSNKNSTANHENSSERDITMRWTTRYPQCSTGADKSAHHRSRDMERLDSSSSVEQESTGANDPNPSNSNINRLKENISWQPNDRLLRLWHLQLGNQSLSTSFSIDAVGPYTDCCVNGNDGDEDASDHDGVNYAVLAAL